ncbi:hypothetical protein [Pseudorhodoplanes sp.]|uniref:hypothetical protein n=1 Tax=Pseudorhodoplanes sp. TaxID=1934341 RepID=UPI002BDCB209|nr:hypothetical protein [Pseudorhodoplanes sp.]HWV51604.1 hypothetical protein [Pseudorhodoplanes sp.]
MLREVLRRVSSICGAVLNDVERCLDRAGDDSDPSLWRLRPGAEAAFDMSPPDETDRELGRDQTHIPTF